VDVCAVSNDGAGTLLCVGPTGAVVRPDEVWSAEREPRRLGLLVVVNSAILGLVAAAVFAVVEIATHVLA
jgi:hypothetical protein